jgi:hypothetical protein
VVKIKTDKKSLNKALFMGKIGHKNMLILKFREMLKLVLQTLKMVKVSHRKAE